MARLALRTARTVYGWAVAVWQDPELMIIFFILLTAYVSVVSALACRG